MDKKLFSRKKFAEIAGVNPSTVSRVSHTLLKGAFYGKRIDAAHPMAQAYLARKGVDSIDLTDAVTVSADELPPEELEPVQQPSPVRVPTAKQQDARMEIEIPDVPENISHLADWTLREILHKFGTDANMVDYLKAAKSIEEIAEKRLKNAHARGELVSRSIVKNGIIDTLDGAFTRILTDGSRTIAARANAMIKSGDSVSDLEGFISAQLSTFIKPTKSKIARVLRNA